MSGQVGANEQAPRGRVVVRDARVTDAEALGRVNVTAWRQAYRGIVSDTYLDALSPTTAAERWRGRIEQPVAGLHLLVAELDDRIAAYATGGPYRTQQDADPHEDTRGWGELFAIYADPAVRGRGAGSAVHDELLARLASDGWRVAALWVLRANRAALTWYDARDWRTDGATSDWLGSGVPLVEVRLVHGLG